MDPEGVLFCGGPLLPVMLHVPIAVERDLESSGDYVPAPIFGAALIDTGANLDTIDVSAVERLSLAPLEEQRSVRIAGEQSRAHAAYKMRFSFPGTPLPDYEPVHVVAHDLAGTMPFMPKGVRGDFIALLGRGFLRVFQMVYDGAKGQFSLRWRDDHPNLKLISTRDLGPPPPPNP